VTVLKNSLQSVEERFRSADKSLAGTLMAELTTMKFDGTRGMHEHILEMTNLAAKIQFTLSEHVDDVYHVTTRLPSSSPYQSATLDLAPKK
jgi:hypothetical protein